MYKSILATVSAIALLASVPAIAETKTKPESSAKPNSTGNITDDAKKSWENIKEDASETYKDIKAVFVDDGNKPVVISTHNTATGMIGKAVYNGNQERVGTVKDIIVDAAGNANMLVIADGEFPGFDGKLVAFDYSTIYHQDANGDVIAPLSEENINNAAEFSYDRDTKVNGKVRVIPTNGYSIEKFLEGQLLDQRGKSVAEIDDISFKNGKASAIVIGFDKVLGLGGEKAAINYDAANIVRNGDDLDFKLNAKQSEQFEVYKKTAVH